MIDGDVPDEQGGPNTSVSLLIRVQADQTDLEAWTRFDNLYRPLVCGWCVKAGLQNADAEDVCQEVFRRVHGAIRRFEWDRRGGTLRGWLRTITSNAISEWGRGLKKFEAGAGGSDARDWMLTVPEPFAEQPDEERDRDEERLLLREALKEILSRFKEQTREAFWRVVIDRHSPAEVARDLGVEEHVIYLAKSRVLKKLRDEYGELIDLKRL